ncbi:MAG: hypothetical protein FWC34_06670 [Bacteroidetes bacterium]|nr:hypothetical protein [Bacteroidota bacterium]MCL2301756.1 hypothetical protein [Lentimicrobiaceae bacterium]
MNYINKTLLSFICLWIFVPCGISQNNPEKKKSSIKPFYSVEVNFGISTCKEVDYTTYSYHIFIANGNAKLAYQTLVYGASFVGGIELAHYFKVGLGLGYLYYKQNDNRIPYSYQLLPNSIITHGLPLFLYLRSDFLDKKISPYMDLKIGNNFLITKETLDLYDAMVMLLVDDYGEFRLKNGLFLASNIGMAFKIKTKSIINVSVGYRYISRSYDMLYYIDPIFDKQEYQKTEFITVDHQFLLNVGISF